MFHNNPIVPAFFAIPRQLKIAFAVSENRFNEVRYPGDINLIECFNTHGITVNKVIWDDPTVNWASYDLVILHQTWDPEYQRSYYCRKKEYFTWLDYLVSQKMLIANHPDIVRAFFNKGQYLSQLAKKGIDIIPTTLLKKGKQHNIASIMQKNEWKEAIIKVSEGDSAIHIYRIINDKNNFEARKSDFSKVITADKITSVVYYVDDFQEYFNRISNEMDFIIQKFMPDIKQYGETSCIFIGGKLTHSILKKTKPDSEEFRTQRIFSEQIPELVELTSSQKFKIQNIYQQVISEFNQNNQPLALRIDVITSHSSMHVMEIEAIDPWLYIDYLIDDTAQVQAVCSQYVNSARQIIEQTRNELNQLSNTNSISVKI